MDQLPLKISYQADSNRPEIVLYDSQTHMPVVHTICYSKSVSLMCMLIEVFKLMYRCGLNRNILMYLYH